jgi:hypothetical protein
VSQPNRPAHEEAERAIEAMNADAERLDGLYSKLSEGDRYYIVSRWDEEHGLIPTYKRQNYKNDVASRARQRKVWIVVACVPAFFVVQWISGMMHRDNVRDENSFVLDSLRTHSQTNQPLKSAIEQADRDYHDYLESIRPEPEE